jgi:hypothetical protein
MNYWIEVTSGLRWYRLLKEKDVRLDAPNTTRHRNFFKELKRDDLVFHYLAGALTPEKEKRSKIVAMSRIVSNPIVDGKRIAAKCAETVMLPSPVSRYELGGARPKSKGLKKLLRVNMQRYLTQISQSDFESILDAHPANARRFPKSRRASN